MSQRRDIRYLNFDDLISDLNQLESNGYSRLGRWDLSQICEHLADWMNYPMDGFPKAPWFISGLLTLIRITRGKALLNKLIQEQRMPANQPTSPLTVHAPNADVARSVNRLRSSIERLNNFQGEIHPSPLFGAMTHEQAVALQLAHCAHHFSFLSPNSR